MDEDAERLGMGRLGLEGGGQSAGACICGAVVVLQLESNWGARDAVGLCGVELVSADGRLVVVGPEMLSVLVVPEGSSDTGTWGGGGVELDGPAAAAAAQVFAGDFVRKGREDMWLAPLQRIGQRTGLYALRIDLGGPVQLHSLRLWNYNASLEESYKGVKRLNVFLDNVRVSPPVGYLVRKGPGPMGGDTRPLEFAQTIRLRPLSERVATPYIFFGSRSLPSLHPPAPYPSPPPTLFPLSRPPLSLPKPLP